MKENDISNALNNLSELLLKSVEVINSLNMSLAEPTVEDKPKRPAKKKSTKKKTPAPKSQKQPIIKTNGPVKWSGNIFVDNFSIEDLDEKDVKTPRVKPTPRNRPKFKMVETKCAECKKPITIHPSENREFVRCENCSPGYRKR